MFIPEYILIQNRAYWPDRRLFFPFTWKYQWDFIHDPEGGWHIFEEVEEGESVDLASIKTEIASSGIDLSQTLTCLSPAGELFTLPETTTRVCFTTDFSGNILHGVLTGYYIENQFYTAVYSFSESKFLGYAKKIGTGSVDVEIANNQIVVQLDDRSQDGVDYVYYGIPSNCKIALTRVQITDLDVEIPSQSHDASGLLEADVDLALLEGETIGEFSDPDACVLPDLDLTVVELQEHIKQVICNPYGEGGFLMMLRINNDVEYVYQNADMEAQDYYYRWIGDNWDEWNPSGPELLSQLDIFKAIFGIWQYLLVENPHEFLDAAGMIPLFGEPADIINGVWYLFDGNQVEASISFGSAFLPVVGDFAGKSIKYLKKVGNSTKIVSLSEEATASFLKVSDKLKGLEDPRFQARLEKLVDDLDQEAAFTPLWDKLANQANGDEIAAVLDNINELPHSERVLLQSNLAVNTDAGAIILRKTSPLAPSQTVDFATDFKTTNLAEAFFENPELVESWKMLDELGETGLGTKVNDIKYIDEYARTSGKTRADISNHINQIGSYPAWRSRYATQFDDYVELIEKESLFGDDALTFLDGEYRTVQTTANTIAYRSFGGNAKVGGTFITTSSGASRTELAILDEWNNSMRFEAKITIPSDVKMNIGKAGPQTSTDGLQTLTGGGDQAILPFQWDTQWVTEIKDINTGNIYQSIEEFAVDFPDLVNP